jgi:hypothetical protein
MLLDGNGYYENIGADVRSCDRYPAAYKRFHFNKKGGFLKRLKGTMGHNIKDSTGRWIFRCLILMSGV